MSSLSINGKVVSLNIEAVIFDKDGTLIDVHHYWSSMIKMRATLIVKKWFSDVNSDKIRGDLINAMGVDLK
jgi:phosphoglycolate phosphatase-like HAD superfamily hydrolase